MKDCVALLYQYVTSHKKQLHLATLAELIPSSTALHLIFCTSVCVCVGERKRVLWKGRERVLNTKVSSKVMCPTFKCGAG